MHRHTHIDRHHQGNNFRQQTNGVKGSFKTDVETEIEGRIFWSNSETDSASRSIFVFGLAKGERERVAEWATLCQALPNQSSFFAAVAPLLKFRKKQQFATTTTDREKRPKILKK